MEVSRIRVAYAALMLLCASAFSAQISQATLTGTVEDATGSAVGVNGDRYVTIASRTNLITFGRVARTP